ncbi:phosphoinositide-3-kinase-interacting protein 1 [Ascaphus truei]|uniref:phosphoinositide-3-kinase-interacting protein 1 n=1 Tax=Ascaphus truei TaxID=8439 RepID=UPI003F5A7011
MILPLLFLLLGSDVLTGTRATSAPSDYPTSPSAVSTQTWEEPAESQEELAAVQPVIGISQRVRVSPREKKDLGALGYVLGILMIVIIIAIGSGIVVGYMYKRGRDLKRLHDQQAEERRIQLINLPLSAFLNPTCEIVDENSIEGPSHQTPDPAQDGAVPLIDAAGTPGA